MTHIQNLKALTKSSARIATFAVRLCDGAVENYTYTHQQTGQQTTAHKFEVFLVGSNPQEYCKGYVKASEEECKKAAAKFSNGTVWALSKVAFDSFTQTQYISTPILLRVDLSKSTMTIQDGSTEENKALRASMPSSRVPPTSVADVTRIKTSCCTDLIAVIKEVHPQTRKSKADELISDIVLVDTTMGSSGKLAAIDVSVFGASKIQQLTAAIGTPMAFFNLAKSLKLLTTVKTKSQLRQNALRQLSCARKLPTSRQQPTQKNLPKYGSQINRGTLADHRHCLALRSWITQQRLHKLLFQM